MRGDVDTIKERLDITEVVSGYIKLEKAGTSFKARCPFHNEKSPSFFVSQTRQSFYCFGCGAKGDIFSFIEEMEGLDFRGALKLLAEKAGVEIEYHATSESKTEKDKIFFVLEEATKFFEKELTLNDSARQYIISRGINEETVKSWRIGYAPAEWRSLYNHLRNLGHEEGIIMKAGLARVSDGSANKEPYDVFRDRIIFPLADSNGSIIAFSGRILPRESGNSKGTEPKYLNSPETILFTKSEVLYGLDKAKDHIRKRDYAVLVEGQMDLVLSHQSGIRNTIASSGTAFTRAHLERLKRLSSRIILAFDGDLAGERAAQKSAILGISLDLEVKVSNLPEGLDPAEVIRQDSQAWNDILRGSLPSVEFFFNKIEEREKDQRKIGKRVEKEILPIIKLMNSAIEQSHFVSMLSKRTGIKEEMFWEDLKKVKRADTSSPPDSNLDSRDEITNRASHLTHREQIEERLALIKLWREELPKSSQEDLLLDKEEAELNNNLSRILSRDDLKKLVLELARAEASKDTKLIKKLTLKIRKVHSQIRDLEEKR
ncbi:MAG: DNA primase [Candidatus Zambryskibacteria bacterium CG_4_9_14_3_um_filter_42_9]|uniref:DNA primase n=1 Tax=Candidatus Zambryskibacteria bacterium CG22_combo_CG10-13_8_21_14_all_42_17 TaxID=1975118 RepID=A0A2H0BF03_9BACT|nr:MAG: DNA primase [Candidatus Zambryskibacteria bacterium CG22_combo_CG10-13_8_21_14_all_42_17]PJA36832.1 MAG: DNA primase [Candidatus Zambryskibacteria bacterium CG_4_9_14_3_um_filter_42_9]